MSPHFLQFLDYFNDKKKALIGSIVLSLIQTATLVPISLIIQYIFDYALPAGDIRVLIFGLGIVVVLFGFNALLIIWNRQLTLTAIKAVIQKIRNQLLTQAVFWQKERYSREQIDILHSKIVNDSNRLDFMASAMFTQFVPGVLIGIGLSIVLIYQNTKLFAVVAIALIILYTLSKLIGRTLKRTIKQYHEDFTGFSHGVLFTLKFIELIKLSTAERYELAQQAKNIETVQVSGQRMALLSTVYTIIQSNILLLAGSIVLLIGGLSVINGTMTIGALLAFYIALNLLTTNARVALSAVPVILEGFESLNSLMPLLVEKNLQVEEKDEQTSLKPFTGFKDSIAFDRVQFSHNPAEPQSFMLQGIDFVIKKGQCFGIIGASGSGKTTLINLLLGLYTPQAGKVAVDMQSITDFDPISYRRKIGVLMQDATIFSGTVHENLVYGFGDEITNDTLRAVCTACQIDETIMALPNGYRTRIGEGGVALSGGQRQRLAIARALLRNPEILILDEPDNNLDEHVWFKIFASIKTRDITTIIITHNHTMRKHFDDLYQLP